MDSASIKRVGIEKAQNFMRQYRDPESRELKKLSANQFMDVWSHYDKDGEKVLAYFWWGFSGWCEAKRWFKDFYEDFVQVALNPHGQNFQVFLICLLFMIQVYSEVI